MTGDRYADSVNSFLLDRWTEEQGRDAVAGRCGGRCEGCGEAWNGQVHHRVLRAHCPRPLLWHPAELIALCGSGTTGCHGLTHHQRTKHEGLGWNVGANADPRVHPAWLRDPYDPTRARWTLLVVVADGATGERRHLIQEVAPLWAA